MSENAPVTFKPGKGAGSPVGVAILGHGTVGSEVLRIMQQDADALEHRIGGPLELKGVAVSDIEKHADAVSRDLLTTDAMSLINRDDVDIVVEVIGGIDYPRKLVLAALRAGKSVVTANKALVAAHSAELAEAADAAGVDLYFEAAVAAARAEAARVRAERAGVTAQQRHLRLVSPADGLVTQRHADPGSTVVAGQAVVEVVDPASLWINVRLDQIRAHGLAAGLPAQVLLRSRAGQPLAGRVLRVEPLADSVTEETLAKVVFNQLPEPLPPLGELAEVTIDLPALAAQPVLPNAAVQRVDGKTGVWHWANGGLQFTPVTLGVADLDGHVQVLNGLSAGDQVVVYSEKPLTARSRIHVVERLTKAAP